MEKDQKYSRRILIKTLGIAGAAMATGGLLNNSVTAQTVTNSVYDTYSATSSSVLIGSIPCFNVKDFGAIGDGIADDTSSINDAIRACANVGGGIVFLPMGTYMHSSVFSIPSKISFIGAGRELTVLKVLNGSSTGGAISLNGNNIKVCDLSIDGNKSNILGNGYGILGYRNSDNIIERISVLNQRGIGIGLSGCWNYIIRDCSVTYCGANSPGFWCDVDTNVDPYNRGNHLFDNIASHYNDLDGIICNCPNTTIINSRFTYNGQNPGSGGALGAGGIYNDTSKKDMRIINNYCAYNTEFGINGVFFNSVLSNNICEMNALAGIFLRPHSARVTISGSVVNNNGNSSTTYSAYCKAGIGFDSCSFLTITGNVSYDDRPNLLQTWGIEAFDFSGPSNFITVTSNALSYNRNGNENVSSKSFTKSVIGNI
ncbi:glycosyl hydrolase family 28-related protein [Paenibacillus elgii]